MSKRFGGQFSPNGESEQDRPVTPLEGKMPQKAGFRVNLLFALPFLFIFSALSAPPVALGLIFCGMGAMWLGAWLTRDGIKAQAAYEARKVARRPAIPRKIFGSVLTGVGYALVSLLTFGLIPAAIFAALAGILHFISFGPDPLKNKGGEGIDEFQVSRVAQAVEGAQAHLDAMVDAVKRARDRDASDRVERFAATANRMFRTVEDDPRDLTGARKWLGVYLQGARDATVKFADIYGTRRDPQAKSDYFALLDDLEKGFAARTEKMLLDDRSDLNIEIEVLRDRLSREGLSLSKDT